MAMAMTMIATRMVAKMMIKGCWFVFVRCNTRMIVCLVFAKLDRMRTTTSNIISRSLAEIMMCVLLVLSSGNARIRMYVLGISKYFEGLSYASFFVSSRQRSYTRARTPLLGFSLLTQKKPRILILFSSFLLHQQIDCPCTAHRIINPDYHFLRRKLRSRSFSSS